ncbi:MAG: alpha-hydroxy-acid oxidizing protein [Bryobacterales bacterium]|nr:alpha-hydroxy-acid oxidizing protein [Bryobacterales bacterium]
MRRRHAILLASGLLRAQRRAPVEELANTLEMEEAARLVLPPALFREISGGDRASFDRITFRPRMMVNTLGIDLTVELFGEKHFAPILAGPMALQGRFHSEGERATGEGARAARTVVVRAAETSVPVESAWVQVTPGKAIPADAKVLVTGSALDWDEFAKLRAATKLPIAVKGIMSAANARVALQRGANGLIISAYRGTNAGGMASPLSVLPSIVEEVAGRAPVLIDGGFRRGSDVLKALALGARAVLVGRPVLWGLAAYGARGVQQVLEQLQTELARDMAMCGLRTCAEATPKYVRIHRR